MNALNPMPGERLKFRVVGQYRDDALPWWTAWRFDSLEQCHGYMQQEDARPWRAMLPIHWHGVQSIPEDYGKPVASC